MKKTEVILLAGICLMAITAVADIGTVAVPTTAVQVLPGSAPDAAGRKWFVLQNAGTNDIYLKMDSSTNVLTTTNGIKLPAGASISVSATAANPARNEIRAISGTGTNTLVYQSGNEN